MGTNFWKRLEPCLQTGHKVLKTSGTVFANWTPSSENVWNPVCKLETFFFSHQGTLTGSTHAAREGSAAQEKNVLKNDHVGRVWWARWVGVGTWVRVPPCDLVGVLAGMYMLCEILEW